MTMHTGHTGHSGAPPPAGGSRGADPPEPAQPRAVAQSPASDLQQSRPPRTLCLACVHVHVVRSAKGSSFLLCLQSKADPRFPKYPPQPVVVCPAFAAGLRPA